MTDEEKTASAQEAPDETQAAVQTEISQAAPPPDVTAGIDAAADTGPKAAAEDARLRAEYPEAAEKGMAGLPEDIARMCGQEGLSLLAGYRLADLRRTRARCDELAERCRAADENRRNALASTGSLAGGEAVERDDCGPGEWDRLPPALQRKFIQNGRVFEFMKRWGKNG